MGYTFTSDNKGVANGRTYRAQSAAASDAVAGANHSGSNALAAAKAGTLTVRGSTTAGSLTLGTGHGVITGDRLDIYFAGGRRYGVTVGTVSGNVVPFTLGAGDNLPVLNAAVTAMVPTVETVVVTGDNAVAVGVSTSADAATAVFAKSDATTIKAVKLAGDDYFWRDDSADDNPLAPANPLAGQTVGKVYLSHSDSAAAQGVVAEIYYN